MSHLPAVERYAARVSADADQTPDGYRYWSRKVHFCWRADSQPTTAQVGGVDVHTVLVSIYSLGDPDVAGFDGEARHVVGMCLSDAERAELLSAAEAEIARRWGFPDAEAVA